MYKAIDIDRKNPTIMGVKFPDIKTLENTANAIGTNMFEGFEPTKELIQLYLDWKTGLKSCMKNQSEYNNAGKKINRC